MTRRALHQAENLPAVFRAIIALDAGNELSVLQHALGSAACWPPLSCAKPVSRQVLISLRSTLASKPFRSIGAGIVIGRPG
jgi:hypothetical protein